MDYIQSCSTYRIGSSTNPSQTPTKEIWQTTKKILYGILQVESKWRKLNMGEVPWRRILQESMDTILLWRVILPRKKGTRVSTRYINRLERLVNIHNSLHPSTTQVKIYLTNAYLRYYDFKEDHLKLRKSWIRDLEDMKSKENGETKTAYTRASWPGRSNVEQVDASALKWGRSKHT